MMPVDEQPRASRIAFESQLLLLILAGGLPALLILLGVLLQSGLEFSMQLLTLSIALLAWLALGFTARRFVVYHLQTLSNLLEALREGDYTLRGRRARSADALGEVTREVNALSHTLHAERLGAREASALLFKIVDVIDIAVFAFDSRRRLILVNRAGERLMARPRDALLHRSASELELEALLGGEAQQTLQHRFPVGSGRWELRYGGFREDGLPHELLVISDLSRTLREEERKAWRRLIRVLGHELNNSLAPIKSMATTLRKLLDADPPPADWREDMEDGLEVIDNRSRALGRFLTRFSMLARLPEPRRKRVDIPRLVERVRSLDTRVPLSVSGPPLTARVDPDQIEQLLINLVKNAMDAAEETDGKVSIRWYAEGNEACLEVHDSGPGVSNPDNLFVPFFTTKKEGTGAGLVLSRQIAEAHGGTVTLENRGDGPGCVACVRLPQDG